MSINDPVGDMLTRIRNAQMRGMTKTSTPASKLRGRVLDVLEAEGFIRGYTKIERENNKRDFEIELKYFDGQPVISKMRRVSKPGRRVYSSVKEIVPVQNGLGISICMARRISSSRPMIGSSLPSRARSVRSVA